MNLLYNSIKKASDKYNVPVYIIYAVINTESQFRQYAKSKVDCRGLMQISKYALKDYNNRIAIHNPNRYYKKKVNNQLVYEFVPYTMNDLYNINLNIEIGTWYLSTLRKLMYSISYDWLDTYGAYNVGLNCFYKNYNDMRNGKLFGKPYNAMKRFNKYLNESYEYFIGNSYNILYEIDNVDF